MPLVTLANEIIRLSLDGHRTPVLVTPSCLALRRTFFVELVDAIVGRADRATRLDWYRPVPNSFSLIGDRLARHFAGRVSRAIAARVDRCEPRSCLQITASIARPPTNNQVIVVGICDQQMPLPKWATAIRLVGDS